MKTRTAFVSGSSRGIGKAIAEKLSQMDFAVYLNGRNESDLENAVADINAKGGHAYAIAGDLTDDKAIREALEQVLKKKDKIDVVVANLGSGRSVPGWAISIAEYRRVFDLNFFSAVSLMTQAIPHMAKNSNLVVISSIAGCESIGAPIAYLSAKAALLAFTKGLSDQVVDLGIRVNAISPGNIYFPGGTWDEKMHKDENAVRKLLDDKVPLKRLGRPSEIADAVEFLLSNEFVVGHNLVIDGGQIRKII